MIRTSRALLHAMLAGALVAGCAVAPAPLTPASSPGASRSASTPGQATPSVSSSPTASPPTDRPTPGPTASPTAVPPPPLARLIGAKLVVAMQGTTPSADLLGRIRRGEVGGVLLFRSNIVDADQVRALTTRLQAAADEGGFGPLLIAVDQEGGIVRRVPWAPPDTAPPVLAAGGTAAARAEGAATGAALRALGITMNLAPVADVPASRNSFLFRQGRTWSFDADTTGTLATAFAQGLLDEGVAPVLKHFPGIGRATENTDHRPVTIAGTALELEADLRPFASGIAAGVPMVMLSNALHPAYDPAVPAGWSRAVAVGLLREDLGFRGISMTDALEAAARSRNVETSTLAIAAAAAGVDCILLADTERATAAVHDALVEAAAAGTIDHSRLVASWRRITRLAADLAGA